MTEMGEANVMNAVLPPGSTERIRADAVYTLAALNGVARIYLGAHNPLDIVGGAGLGVTIAGALNLAFGVPAQGQETDQHR